MRFIAAMRPSVSILLYIKQCWKVTGHTDGNADLPNPPVPVSDVDDHINDLHDAEQALHDGTGTVGDRDAKLVVVKSDMGLYIAYAEAQANANPEKGAAIIESGGFHVVKRTNPARPDLAAKHGKTPGVVILVARARKRPVSYYWQMCESPASPNPVAWLDLPETHVAKATVHKLTPGTTYAFRYCTMTREGTSEWSSPVLIMAH